MGRAARGLIVTIALRPSLSVTAFARLDDEPLTQRCYRLNVNQGEHDAASAVSPAQLRQAVLMAAVLDDVDVTPTDDGVVVAGPLPLQVSWTALAHATEGTDPTSMLGRARLVRWLRLAVALSEVPLGGLREHLRPVALTPGHVLHPGPDWVCTRVEGGVIELGLGMIGLRGHDPDTVVIIPSGVIEALGADPTALWPTAHDYLERMGTVAAQRLQRDRHAVLRPMGDCDVLTLLGSRVLRTELAMADGVGMRGMAVPMRTRGWTDPDHVDSAFARAAALATDEDQRGLPSAVLVTPTGIHFSIGRHVASDFTLREVKSSGRHRRPHPGMRDVRYRST